MMIDAPLRTAGAVGLGTHFLMLAVLAATNVPLGPPPQEFPGAFAAEIRPVRAEAISLAESAIEADDPAAAPFESPFEGLPAEPEVAVRHRAIGLDGAPIRRRARLAAEGGGSTYCGWPVPHALNWLACHQEYDGSWSCDHGKAPRHVGPAFDGGSRQSRGGSTGLALLCYLGVGQTHIDGDYPEVVRLGLRYLLRQGRPGPRGIDFRGPHGDLYDHGIVALALCEAYDQTGDPVLAAAAQGALDYTAFAQDQVGGGWRYLPGEAGDVSVTAWHLQALRSGHLAGLRIETATIRKAAAFLDAVQTDGGAGYGYRSPVPRPGTTAIGLLCRLHCGHDPHEPALRRGIEAIVRRAYDPRHPYDAYYRTQLTAYLERDREFHRHSEPMTALEDAQVRRGSYQEECGSWPALPGGPTAAAGGRLVTTALSCLAVEVRAGQLRIFEATSRR